MRHDAPAALPLLLYVLGLTIAPLLVDPRLTTAGVIAVSLLALRVTRRDASVGTRGSASATPVGGRNGRLVLVRPDRSVWATLNCASRTDTASSGTDTPVCADESCGRAPARRYTGGLIPLLIGAMSFAAGTAIATRSADARRDELRVFRSFDPQRFATVEASIDHDWALRGSSYLLRIERFRANGRTFEQPLLVYCGFEPPPIRYSRTVVAEGFLRRNERGTFVLSIKSPELMRYSGTLPKYSPARWNRALAQRIAPYATDHRVEVALVEALVLGRGERLNDDVRESFKRGGTYHLLVFSGLQIAIAAGTIAWLLRFAHATRASDWLLLLFAFLAPPFIGSTASVSRASIGIGLYALSRLAKRPTSIENLWCVAALGRLVAAPADIADPAFLLTYAGAGSLLFIAKPFTGRFRWLLGAAAAEVVIVPLTLAQFHQYAIGGSLMTIAMTPVIFVMLIASAFACALPSHAIFRFIGLLHALCGAMNSAGSTTSGFFTAPPPLTIAFALIASLLAIAALTGRRRATVLAMAFLIPSIAAVVRARALRSVDSPQMIALDVGQGDSIAVRAKDRVILVDGGGRNDAVRFGESVLLPLLVDRGIRRVDVLALTHAHPDHCGGLPAVIEHLDVGAIWINPKRFTGECAQNILAAAMTRRTPIHIVHDGDRIRLDPIFATAFTAGGRFRRAAENNNSLVLRVQSERRRVLLTGDVEADAEERLGGRIGACDVLKVAHHGSRSSSTPRFLDEIAPHVAVISCGRDNRFGHPHPAVTADLRARRIVTRRTDRNGTITIALRDGLILTSAEIDTPH